MKFFLIITFILMILFGCSTEAEINIINRTNNNLYVGIDNELYTLEGSVISNPNISFTIDTGKKYPFMDETTNVEMYLEGETFMMQVADSHGYTQDDFHVTTVLQIEQGETRNIYCDPTHAGFKVYNNFDKIINSVKYYSNNDEIEHVCATNLEMDNFIYQQLIYYMPGDTIYYTFKLEFADETENIYGGQGNLMELDELFFIDKDTAINE